MDKTNIAIVVVVCIGVFSCGILVGRFIIPAEISAPTIAPTSLEEIYEEFYYELEDWENTYPAHLWEPLYIDIQSSGLQFGAPFSGISEGHKYYIIRQALEDFDTVIEKFLNNVEENGYESRVEEEFIEYDVLLGWHTAMGCLDYISLEDACEMAGWTSRHTVPDLKEGLRTFIR